MNTIETMGFPTIIPCHESLANKEVILHQALVYIMVRYEHKFTNGAQILKF